MNIIVLLAGSSADFTEKGHAYPKYLLEIDNKPIVQRVIESLKCLDNVSLNFLIRKEDSEKFYLGNTIKILAPNANIIEIENTTKGAACTALYAIDQIDNDDELLVINGDILIKSELKEPIELFRANNYDGGILTFNSVHPRWSYVLLDENSLVIQTSEKRPISNNATVGCYYYKKGSDFVKACMQVIEKDVQTQGLYYISSTYNELILEQKKVGTFEIPRKNYISFANYQMYEHFLAQRKEA